MKIPIHPKDIEFQGIPGYLARPEPKARKPKWVSRLLGSMVEKEDGTWAKAPQLERGRGGIQEEVEIFLESTKRPFFRLPDLLMYAISPACLLLPIGWKQHIASYISDWPDLLIPRLHKDFPYPFFLALELKSAAGKQSKGQRLIGDLVACKVAHSTHDAIAIIEHFFDWNPLGGNP